MSQELVVPVNPTDSVSLRKLIMALVEEVDNLSNRIEELEKLAVNQKQDEL